MARTGADARSTRKTVRKAVKKAVKAVKKAVTKRASASRSSGISRIDQDSTRTHGYVVRVDYRQTDTGWRPKHKAFFGDATHGGPRKALAAAEAWLGDLRKTKKPAKKRAAR